MSDISFVRYLLEETDNKMLYVYPTLYLGWENETFSLF